MMMLLIVVIVVVVVIVVIVMVVGVGGRGRERESHVTLECSPHEIIGKSGKSEPRAARLVVVDTD